MIDGPIVPVIVDGITARKDGSVGLKLETQEVTPHVAAQLFELRGKVAFCYISPREIADNAKKLIDSMDPELKGKTPGQRLRNVLYVAWTQSPEGYKDGESYYRAKMESIINGIKQELQP
jgi:hypothetical protein